MNKKLKDYILEIIREKDIILSERKEALEHLSSFIKGKVTNDETVNLNFICTHNSRRSHLCQVWAATAIAYYKINNINTFSGGTEATAFNPRAVAALERAGFNIKNPGGDNPKYAISINEQEAPMVCFSKTWDDQVNPTKNLIAVMTCADAEKNCPFIPGADLRIPIKYVDPKESDGTAKESSTYDERCRQIAREMFYLASQLI